VKRTPGKRGLAALGPTTRGWLAALGISDDAALAAHDAITIGTLARAAGFAFSLNGCYAVAAAQLGIDWRCLPPALRDELATRWRAALTDRCGTEPRAGRRR
jgi:hypothetical protein